MINSTQELYQLTLQKIRKRKSSVLPPTQWNMLINHALVAWKNSKVPHINVGQKRLDDLGFLRVITEAPFNHNDPAYYSVNMPLVDWQVVSGSYNNGFVIDLVDDNRWMGVGDKLNIWSALTGLESSDNVVGEVIYVRTDTKEIGIGFSSTCSNTETTIMFSRNEFVYSTFGTTDTFPFYVDSNGVIEIPNGNYGYQEYWRLIDMYAKIAYNNDRVVYPDTTTGDKWILCKFLNDNEKDHKLNDVYDQPGRKFAYYQRVGNYFKIYTRNIGAAVYEEVQGLRLEYYRQPRQVWFDESSPADHTTEEFAPYVAGYGSIFTDLPQDRIPELLDIAVRMYLENVSDPRWQTYSIEEMKQIK